MTGESTGAPEHQVRISSLLQQVHVLNHYQARIGDDFLSADTLFYETKPGEPAIVLPLHQTLYEKFYCRLELPESHRPSSEFPSKPPGPTEFLELLRSANSGREMSRSEWKLFSLTSNGQAFVTNGETVHVAEPGDFSLRQLQNAETPEIDYVMFRTERTSRETGFYFGMGETPADAIDRTLVSRLYFNLAPDAALEWFRLVTKTFNRAQLPYTMKCPLNPEAFKRSDSCVLYVPRRYLSSVLIVVHPILRQLRDQLRPTTPMFTRPIVPGVGFADDPGTGESFGQHRMRLVARALCFAQQAGTITFEQKWECVVKEFSANELLLDRPYLAPNAPDFDDVDFAEDVVQ
ncbi:MAG: hypothetical protein JNM43_29515 [Planctomycetaceae bacterium]|nr:hypothetical protein [Planctomycetaceae bacterium]